MKNNLNKIFIMFVMLGMFFTSSFAITQNELINFEFEEGGGSIAIDSSGFDNHGGVSGASWTTTSKNGNFGLDFDGSNDFVTIISSQTIPNEFTFSFWIRPLSSNDDILLNIYDTTDLFQVWIDSDGGADNLYVEYKDETQTIQTINIDSDNFATNTYHFISMTYNSENQTLKYYRDNVLKNTLENFDLNRDSNNNLMRLGANIDSTQSEFDGYMDSFHFFDSELNNSQIAQLYNFNNVTLFIEEDDDNSNISQEFGDIISSFSPINTNESNKVVFDLNLNQKADCDFYLNNNLAYEFKDIVSIKFEEVLEEGEHKYFYYCSVIENQSEIIEISEIVSFQVSTPDTQITFQISGNDFDVDDEELYIQTPCSVEGYSAIGMVVGHQARYNTNGIHWAKVENGLATMNLSSTNHEICLFNGRVIVNEAGQTTNYNVQEVRGQLELGNFSIPNTQYQVYKLNVDTFEIYDITNPKAYGKDWSGLAGALIMLLLGGLLTYGGVRTESKVLTLIGGTLLLGAFGLSISGIITLLNI